MNGTFLRPSDIYEMDFLRFRDQNEEETAGQETAIREVDEVILKALVREPFSSMRELAW
jgi:hypothetical protein